MHNFLHRLLKSFSVLVMAMASAYAQATTMNVTIKAQITNNANGALDGIVNVGDVIDFNIVVDSNNADANPAAGAYKSTSLSNVETLFIVLVDGPANITTTGSTAWTATGLLDLTSSLPGMYLPWVATVNGVGMTPDQILANFSSVTGGNVTLDASGLSGPGMTLYTNVLAIGITTWTDSDGDGVGDAGDNDDDNDQMTDAWEIEFGTNPLVNDANADPDGDGVINYDEFFNNWDPLSTDMDGDGVTDSADNCVKVSNPAPQSNIDGDWYGDACDTDDDGDGMSDQYELANGLDPAADDSALDLDSDGASNITEFNNGSDPADTDSDNDTMTDGSDNCPTVPNHPNHEDTDADGMGDACDNDDDGDGMTDAYEIARGMNPLVNDSVGDLDGDGVDNSTEISNGTNPNAADTDGDTVDDLADNCPLVSNSTQTNTDISHPQGDTLGDACDSDDDADTMPDFYEEQFGLNPIVDDTADDLDGDGYTNLEELQRGTFPNVFNPSLVRNDINADGDSDLLMRNATTGAWRVFGMANAALAGFQDVSIDSSADTQFITRLDVNGDNKVEVLTRNAADGSWTAWTNNLGVISSFPVDASADLNWIFQGAGDFNGDGREDLLLRHATTRLWQVYYLNSDGTSSTGPAGIYSASEFVTQGIGDLNGDHKDELLFRSTVTGAWYVYNFTAASVYQIGAMWRSLDWGFQALIDVNKDGREDIICRNTNLASSEAGFWRAFRMNASGQLASQYALTSLYKNPTVISLADVGDYDGNGTGDLLLRNSTTGQHYMFTTNTPAQSYPGLQSFRGSLALPGSPWAALK